MYQTCSCLWKTRPSKTCVTMNATALPCFHASKNVCFWHRMYRPFQVLWKFTYTTGIPDASPTCTPMASVKLKTTQEPLLESAIIIERSGANADDVSEKTERDFGVYQLVLFAVTQIGYFPVAASMLSTTFFEANAVSFVRSHLDVQTRCFQDTCRHLTRHNNGSGAASEALRSRILQTEFQSLLLEWQEECRASPLQVAVSSSVMRGQCSERSVPDSWQTASGENRRLWVIL